ncbi:helix-turn-helix transcriptional regulator [Nocardia farcinica]|uniref:helix-turn-helix transcriptional regulator n=1 Tax=Nocardia farcinica TaxID=37329 RepID=UPI002455B1C3|nr:helix-turn-helix domain-containing protein [Nocardia farcinica]
MSSRSGEALTPAQLAERYGMSEASLAQWRYLRRGPSYIKAGRKVLYPLAAVEEYERRNTVECA